MKVGIYLQHLGMSQLATYAINSINSLLQQSCEHDIVIFQEDLMPAVVPPLCAVMPSNEIWSFDGLLICTKASQAISAQKCVSKITPCYYSWDLEWLRPHGVDFDYMQTAYKIPVVARSKSHAEAIEKYSGTKPVMINPKFNIEEFIDEFRSSQGQDCPLV